MSGFQYMGNWISNTSSGDDIIFTDSLSNDLMIDDSNSIEILGDDYCGSFDKTPDLVILISTLNVLKRPFWDKIKKNGISLSSDMEKFIENRLYIIERDDKINSVCGFNIKTPIINIIFIRIIGFILT